MRLAIQQSDKSFSNRWVLYCQKKKIPYKLVDVYQNNIMQQFSECDIFMWHFGHSDPKDILFAKQLLFALQQNGIKVFPDFNTAWHFDDKVGQKYLLEAIKAPIVPTYIFYDKNSALQWSGQTTFPKVFKLRRGAGSANVKLARSKEEADTFINRCFGKGFRQYEPITNLAERWRKYRLGKTDAFDLFKGVMRIYKEPEFSRIIGYERGYAYFQDFIPQNQFDIRVIVINKKAFALKRMVREGDFRASGSGFLKYDKEEFDERCIRIAFDTSNQLNTQCLAYDFVFDEDHNPLIIEVSFGFAVDAYDPCPGYWDENLYWHSGTFNPQEWMMELVLKESVI